MAIGHEGQGSCMTEGLQGWTAEEAGLSLSGTTFTSPPTTGTSRTERAVETQAYCPATHGSLYTHETALGQGTCTWKHSGRSKQGGGKVVTENIVGSIHTGSTGGGGATSTGTKRKGPEGPTHTEGIWKDIAVGLCCQHTQVEKQHCTSHPASLSMFLDVCELLQLSDPLVLKGI